MRRIRWQRWYLLAMPGAALLGVGACLGPNPGFFVASSAANAAIFSVVSSLLTTVPNTVISTLISFLLKSLLPIGP